MSSVFQVVIVSILFVIAMFVHRPIDNLSVFQSVVYYTPVYLYGVIFSINKYFIYTAVNKYVYHILVCVIILAVLQASLGHVGNYHKDALVFGGIDLLLIQKFLMCNFFAIWLHRYEFFNNKHVTLLASASFSVFFLHPFIIWFLSKFESFFIVKYISKSYPWLLLIFSTCLVILICILIAKLTKKVTPKYSRYFIGY